MAIKGIIFDNQAPTAKGLRGGFHSALSDGIIEGCNITASGSNVTITSGLMNVAGGIFAVTGSQAISVEGTSGYARIKAVLDLSKTATTEQFGQVYFAVDYANALTTFTNLVQQDVNAGSGTLYEAEICTVALGSSGATGVARKYIAAPKIRYGDVLPDDATEGTIFLLKAD